MHRKNIKPFVKRINYNPIGDIDEPLVMRLPSSREKVASPVNRELLEWSDNNLPKRNVERLIVTALGSAEGYGPNVNGDGFHEDHLLSTPKDVFLGSRPYEKPIYMTFVDFSKLFRNHRNRQHDQSYGEIPFASYNKRMRRVEVIIDIYADDDVNQDILNNIEHNILPGVSMGFRCVPPDTLIETASGQKRIDSILPGEMVYTHTGHLRPVKKVMVSKSPDSLILINTTGSINKLVLTEGHEVFAIKKSQVKDKNSYRVSDDQIKSVKPDWVLPEKLEIGDYLTEAVFHSDVLPDYEVNENIAYLFGLYLGDGSVSEESRYGKRVSAVSIECDAKHDKIYKKIANACFALGWSVSFSFTTKNTLRATIRHKQFGTLAKKLFGYNSHTKTIHQSVFNWDNNCKKMFIGGYFDADGHFDGSLRASSVSEDLSHNIKHLLWSLDIPATIHKDVIGVNEGSYRSKRGYAFIVTIAKSFTSEFMGFCQKIPDDYNFGKTQRCLNFIFSVNNRKYIAKRVNVVETIDSYCNKVWNLEVATDNSYVANEFIVHNCVPGDVCSVCENYNNPFPNRSFYCNHLKRYMLQIDPETGKLCYAVNPNGYFFDLSIVRRPADRIAWGMKRIMITKEKDSDRLGDVAMIKSASAAMPDFIEYSSKIAEEDGLTDDVEKFENGNTKSAGEVGDFPDAIFNVIKKDPDPEFRELGLPLLYRTDTSIDKTALSYIAQKYPMSEITTTMVACGIVPKPEEFQRMVLESAGQGFYADYLDKQGWVFEIPEELDYSFDCTAGNFNEKLAMDLAEYGIIDRRSYYSPFLVKRAAMIKQAIGADSFFERFPLLTNPTPIQKVPENHQQAIITQGVNNSSVGQYYRKYPNPVLGAGRYQSALPEGATVHRRNNPLIPIAAIGAMYGGARWISGFSKKGPIGKAMSKNPLVAAGALGAAAALSWIISNAGINPGGKVASDITTAKALGSLGKDYLLHILTGVALSYGLAGRAEKKREFGIQPSIVEEAFEKRPLFGSAVLALGLKGGLAAIGKYASEEIAFIEDGIMNDASIIKEYPPKYLDKIARKSLIQSTILLKSI